MLAKRPTSLKVDALLWPKAEIATMLSVKKCLVIQAIISKSVLVSLEFIDQILYYEIYLIRCAKLFGTNLVIGETVAFGFGAPIETCDETFHSDERI